MSINNPVLVELNKLLKRLKAQETEAVENLERVRANMESVDQTIALYSKEIEGAPFSMTDTSEKALVNELKQAKHEGKSHVEALKIIAEHSNGLIKGNDAKRMFVEAGMCKNPENAASSIYAALSRGDFEKVTRGVYRAINLSGVTPTDKLENLTHS